MASKSAKRNGVGCLVVLALGAIGFYVTSRDWGPVLDAYNDLDAALAKAKAAGLPMSAEEMKPYPPVPPEENAGPTLLKLEEAIRTDPDEAAEMDSPKGQAMMARMMPLIKELVKFKRLDMNPDWDLGPEVPTRGGSALRYAAKVHQREAIKAAQRKDHQMALEELKAADHLVELLYDSPTVIDSLIAKAIHEINCTTATRVAEAWTHDPQGLSLLQRALTKPKLTPYSRTLDGEFFCGLVIARNHMSLKDLANASVGGPTLDPKTVKRSGLPTSPMHRANLAVFANTIADLKRTSAQQTDMIAMAKELDRVGNALPDTLAHTMTRLIFPFSASVKSYAQSEVFTEMRDAVVKLHQHRLKTGSFPSTLADAGIDITDPFNGEGVIYRGSKNEFVIYTVGMSGEDRGGPERMGNPGFRYPTK